MFAPRHDGICAALKNWNESNGYSSKFRATSMQDHTRTRELRKARLVLRNRLRAYFAVLQLYALAHLASTNFLSSEPLLSLCPHYATQ